MTADPYMPSLLERCDFWAKRYLEKGFNVILNHGLTPEGNCTCHAGANCTQRGKHPVESRWQKKSALSYEEIKAALDKKPYNLGIVTGLEMDGAYIVAADFDKKKGGMNTLAGLRAAHPDWPVGPEVDTGGDGKHYLFVYHEALTTTTDVLPGMDVRSRGGQIVAAPSMHRSGRRYAWADGTWDLPIPALPAWLAEIMQAERPAVTALEPKEWLMNQPVSVEGHGGSKTLMAVTAGLIRKCGVRTAEKYLEVIGKWNALCEPPWSDKELEHAFGSAMRRFASEGIVDLPINKKGEVVLSRGALDKIVRTDPLYEFAFTYNKLQHKTLFNSYPVTGKDFTDVQVDIANRYCLKTVPMDEMIGSIESSARDNGFHPVVEWLNTLTWDGVPRLATFAAEHLGAERPIEGIYFRRWAIGAVRRAFEPGCKMDDVLVFRGDQSVKKSTFFGALAGDWFSDTNIDLGNKDVYQQLQTWIIEWAELGQLKGASIDRAKAFLSSACDRYRPPYGRTIEEFPRSCVIVGSVNERCFLTDPTGDRRFWVLHSKTPEIDLNHVRSVRGQLFAEAVVLCRAGERHWLEGDEKLMQREGNASFRVTDRLFEAATEVIDLLVSREGFDGILRSSLVYEHVMTRPGIVVTERSTGIARALAEAGFEKTRLPRNEKGVREWVYKKQNWDGSNG